jgi:hypothetical protein
VDLETVTNQELRENFWIVRKQLAQINWKDMVKYSVEHLPFGLNQTLIAWDGFLPCMGCPDAMLDIVIIEIVVRLGRYMRQGSKGLRLLFYFGEVW